MGPADICRSGTSTLSDALTRVRLALCVSDVLSPSVCPEAKQSGWNPEASYMDCNTDTGYPLGYPLSPLPPPPPPSPPSPPPLWENCGTSACNSAVWNTYASNGQGTCGEQIVWVMGGGDGSASWEPYKDDIAASCNFVAVQVGTTYYTYPLLTLQRTAYTVTT